MVICEHWVKCQRRKMHIARDMTREDLEPSKELISDITPNRVVYCQECKQVHLLWEKYLDQQHGTMCTFPKITRPQEE